jgi:hypothetical protein
LRDITVNTTSGWRSQRRGQFGNDRQRGGHRRQPKMAGQTAFQRADLVVHRARIADNAARPVEHALAFRSEADKARLSIHQQHAETFFELLQTRRQRRLRDATGIGGAAKMLLTSKCEQHLQLVDQAATIRRSLAPERAPNTSPTGTRVNA